MSNSARLHSLLLLSDSALPLGSFAFSSGLESFLAHRHHHNIRSINPSPFSNHDTNSTRAQTSPAANKTQAFHHFLNSSLLNTASTALPYVLAGYRDPASLARWDDEFDASTTCTVARRASITQGKALLTVWERALHSSVPTNDDSAPNDHDELASIAAEQISKLAHALKTLPRTTATTANLFTVTNKIATIHGHLAPFFGAVSRALGLSAQDTAYVFLLNHAKAVLSAAVRSSVFGPYQSQMILAGEELQRHVRFCIERYGETRVEDAAVTVPVMDLWMGRHELLYSRIFNS